MPTRAPKDRALVYGHTPDRCDWIPTQRKHFKAAGISSLLPTAHLMYLADNDIPLLVGCDNGLKTTWLEMRFEEVFGCLPNECYFSYTTKDSGFDEYGPGLGSCDLIITVRTPRGSFSFPLELKHCSCPDARTKDKTCDKHAPEAIIRSLTIFQLAIHLHCWTSKSPKTRPILDRIFMLLPPSDNRLDSPDALANIDLLTAGFEELLSSAADSDHPYEGTPLMLLGTWFKNLRDGTLESKAAGDEGRGGDLFLLSDTAFLRGMIRAFRATRKTTSKSDDVSRLARSFFWLAASLRNLTHRGKVDRDEVTGSISLNKLNDKAFNITGTTMAFFIDHPALSKPRFDDTLVDKLMTREAQAMVSAPDTFGTALMRTRFLETIRELKSSLHKARSALRSALRHNAHLLKENDRLRATLKHHGIEP